MSPQPPMIDPEDKQVVLAVDDVPENLSTIAEMVRELGVTVRVASSGLAALRYAALAPRPDLILLDVMMPGMDGYQTLARLREEPLTRDIPVIFVTALDRPGEEEAGLLAGAVDYITKPLQPEILRARVRTQLELKRNRDRQATQQVWLEQEVARRTAENIGLQTRLQLAVEAAGFCVWEYDVRQDRFTWSDTFSRILGWPEPPATLAALRNLVHAEDFPAIDRRNASLANRGTDVAIDEVRLRHADGHWVWVEVRGRSKLNAADGQAEFSQGTIVDISARKAAETERQLASIVFTGINDGVCITDANANIQLVNEAFTRVTGYTLAEIRGKNPRQLKSDRHNAYYYQRMWASLTRHGSWQGEITNRRKNGELVSEWLSISAVRDNAGRLTHYIAIFSDLSERKAAAERIQYLSSYDPLTNLPNRSLFADRLTQALLNAHRYSRQTTVLLFDVNRFHAINETFGPLVGDQILIELAQRLSQQIRDGDTVGRRSGNEFGFVLANVAHERDTIDLAQRMLDTLNTPFEVNGQTLTLTASIGISLAPRDGDTAEALLKTAETALIRAKVVGGNTFRFYSPGMDADAARRLGLEAALSNALANDELSVVYQPQISLDSGRLIGMEALLRWHNPQFGNVSPGEFIPIAEETGLIVPIGEWVLGVAARQTKAWLDLGFGSLRCAVNLSPRQFHQPNLTQMIQGIFCETGLPPAALELEITENAFIDDVEAAALLCRDLKALGLKLSLDDFGTGYSSLAYISRFPFDKLKIDQGFVNDIIENPINAAIASAAIVMARSLNLSVLAEGVETEAQARFLRSRRCDAIQGYLFSRPLPPAEFATLLAVNKRLPLAEEPKVSAQTLLIVDDEPNVLSALTRLLRREDYQVLNARTSGEAFEILTRQPVQVVISDLRMPDMTGVEFLSRVRQLYPETIRMILTAYNDIEAITGAINRGAVYKFLSKPWDDDELREQIREAFRLVKEGGPPKHPALP